MADCNETLRELFVFLDDELDPSRRDIVLGHLSDCPDCVHAFDFHAELKAVIARRCTGDEIPSGLLDRIRACFGGDSEG